VGILLLCIGSVIQLSCVAGLISENKQTQDGM